MKCIRKEQFDCIRLTKENRDEFLKVLEPCIDGKNIFIAYDNNKRCSVRKLNYGIHHYFYNDWYVLDWNEGTWSRYTDDIFKEEFELVE